VAREVDERRDDPAVIAGRVRRAAEFVAVSASTDTGCGRSTA
jgi:hypothetical protein